MAKAKHIPYKPTFVVIDRIVEGDWEYVFDGDWRATSERLGLRTRYKNSKQAAEEDIKAGRLQQYISGGWVDHIRG